MQCQNCLHYDVCLLSNEDFIETARKNGFCSKFKDARRFIELPCRVGDRVFHLAHGYIEQEHVRGVHVQFLTDGYGFSENDMGETVFFDYNKAKNVLDAAQEEYRQKMAERARGNSGQ